jgi:hypothetical protein
LRSISGAGEVAEKKKKKMKKKKMKKKKRSFVFHIPISHIIH